MKKSEHTVTLPIYDYERLMKTKDDYERLINDIKKTVDTESLERNQVLRISEFELIKVLKEKVIPMYKDNKIIIS